MEKEGGISATDKGKKYLQFIRFVVFNFYILIGAVRVSGRRSVSFSHNEAAEEGDFKFIPLR